MRKVIRLRVPERLAIEEMHQDGSAIFGGRTKVVRRADMNDGRYTRPDNQAQRAAP